jgi:CheY-like chemotaxis protein
MEKIAETTQSPSVVAVVQCRMNISESNEDNQNQFESTLKAEHAAMRSAILDFPGYGAQIAQQHPLRILIAEDSMVNMKIALWFLKKLGYRVDVAFNGVEVIDAMNRRNYDVIFMDAEMPEMDGRETTITIRKSFPVNQQPHIIAMTANANEGDREEYLSVGMDDYITKPLRIEELVQVLIAARPLPAVTTKVHLAIDSNQAISMVA